MKARNLIDAMIAQLREQGAYDKEIELIDEDNWSYSIKEETNLSVDSNKIVFRIELIGERKT